ncbi:MAG: phenylalanine--tRNA ligase beta subunit [Betaproteobacteria bacterium]|nr:MAG: phenylalanine--tRNA ligase beta subunit [Betaproteobacteria bacterium]
MKFSERWLRTMADPPLGTAALCDTLTMAGLEVEATEPAAPPFSGVVVARIEAVAPHPDADRLRVCTVDAGTGSRLAIVCGAPNAAAGMTVACALVGAQLPGGLAIARAKVRGVASEGMLCSAKELGLADDASGLMPLPGDLAPGTDLREALALDDTLITLKLTPNRADCLSILGIAREVAAQAGAALRPPPVGTAPAVARAVHGVRVEDPAACPRFASRVIEGVDARAPTPEWMKQRLARSGIRAISAIVDVTNYVMLELGQPLHAYDRALLEGDVVVRFAKPGEKLVLLNEETLDLEPDLLLVCDEAKPLGLAGIMGGAPSGIAGTTTAVFLEGAFWNPAVLQGKMRRLGFASDAGHRFERGVDFELPPQAVERATQLILDICGGRAGPLSDVKGPLPARAPVRVRASRVRRLLGVAVDADAMAGIFARLGFAFAREGDEFVVTPPSYRFDLAIEEDFVEEVARTHGYERIPAIPSAHAGSMLPAPEAETPLAALKALLVARDWQEVVTFGFVDGRVQAALDPAGVPVRVLNPIAAHLDVMRRTLLPGLVETLRTNLARKASRVRVFEAGRVFLGARADEAVQPWRLGGLAWGDALGEQWGTPSRPVDLFDVKADLAALVAPAALTTRRGSHPALHPGRAAEVLVDGRPAGWLGELHPRLARQFELGRAPVVFELDLASIRRHPVPAPSPVSRQPLVRRDLAVVVDDALPAQDVLDALEAAAPAHVEAVRLFDVYRGSGLPSGRKSLAILVLMQDTARTLTDADIESTLRGMIDTLAARFGATLRTLDAT